MSNSCRERRGSSIGLLAVLVLVSAACNGRIGEPLAEEPQDAAGPGGTPCVPLETRAPNAAGQAPTFPGQTRACAVTSAATPTVVVLATGLEHPWSVEPLPGGDLLVTERPGRMRIVSAGGALGAPIAGLPQVDARGQGGLLDVALSPDFEDDRTLFWSYAEPRQGGNGTAVARGVLSPDRTRLEQVRVIFRAMPTYDGTMHYGSRLAFAPGGLLWITTGERSDAGMRHHAQEVDNHLGKVLRIRPDGSVPADNPFAGQAGAAGEVWSYGHRNVQAAGVDPEGRLWTVEHGPRGGDELNMPQAGANHGWPVVTFGEEYSGRAIEGAVTAREDVAQPVYYWDPVIAPSGLQFYTGDAFPAWRGNVFVGGMVAQALVRLVLEDGRVVGEEHLFGDRGRRIRDVRQGPDGYLYVVTDEDDGQLWRITP